MRVAAATASTIVLLLFLVTSCGLVLEDALGLT